MEIGGIYNKLTEMEVIASGKNSYRGSRPCELP